MSLHHDLLEQAGHLAIRESKRPRQASLCRAVSTAYYALFHFIGEESARALIGGGAPHKGLRQLACRSLAHGKVKSVCIEFQKTTPRQSLEPFWTSMRVAANADLREICKTFADLQQARHAADYDQSQSVSRASALDACKQAREAIDAWYRLKSSDPVLLHFFATVLILWPGLTQPGAGG
jgi:uncharacterized protein (UPF0332 family)